MKNIKSILVTILCVLSCAVLLCACQNPETPTDGDPTPAPSGGPTEVIDPTKPGEIKMQPGDVYRIFVWSNTTENKWIEDGTEEGRARWEKFQNDYDVTVTWVANPNSGDWINAAMQPAAAGEPIADIFHMGGPFAIPQILGYGGSVVGSYFEDINQYKKYTNIDNGDFWDQGAIETMGTYNGKLYVAYPYDEGWGAAAVNMVTFFNKNLISNGGYTAEDMYTWYKNGEWTFDKFREVALACTDADKGVYGTIVGENGLIQAALVAANGGSILTPDANGIPKFSADSDKALRAYNFFLDMCKTDGSVYTEGGVNQAEGNLFKNGTAAMMITYANRVPQFSDIDGFEFGIILPPKGPDATEYASDKNWATPFCMFKGHANPAGVAQCLSYYLCPTYGMSTAEQAMKLEADAQAYFQDNESIQTLKDAVKYNVTTSYMAYWSVSESALAKTACWNFNKWVAGESTPEIDFAANKDLINAIIESTIAGSEA